MESDTKRIHTNEENQGVRLLHILGRLIFVVGSSLVVFAAFRNSITWHFQRFWGASGDFWQSLWDKFLDYTQCDEPTLYVFGTFIWTTLVYWGVGSLYIYMDVTTKPKVLIKYKVQPGINEPVDKKKLLKAIRSVIFNQCFVGLPLMYGSYLMMQIRGLSSLNQLPTFHWVLFEIGVFILAEEITFYYSHRLLHTKYLYTLIHKKHHEWITPVSVTAIYCHPIEHILSNLLPLFSGVFIMGSHLSTIWLWYTLAIINTLGDHSGYHLPFLPSPEFHYFHHLKFNQCYGVLGLLDRLHGTDKLFRNSKAYNRHLVMLNFTPIRELYPDENKTK